MVSVWVLLILAALAGIGIWEIAQNYIPYPAPTKSIVLLELEARLERNKVDFEGMEVKNEECKRMCKNPEYSSSDFEDIVDLIFGIEKEIERIQKEG